MLSFVQESNFSELERAFAEARRRSLEQDAGAEKKPVQATEDSPAADGAGKGKTVASKASAVATPKVNQPSGIVCARLGAES